MLVSPFPRILFWLLALKTQLMPCLSSDFMEEASLFSASRNQMQLLPLENPTQSDREFQELVIRYFYDWKKITARYNRDHETSKSMKELKDLYSELTKDTPPVKTKFTPKEDQHLLDLVQESGRNWPLLTKHFINKTCLCLKNRYYYLERKNKKTLKGKNKKIFEPAEINKSKELNNLPLPQEKELPNSPREEKNPGCILPSKKEFPFLTRQSPSKKFTLLEDWRLLQFVAKAKETNQNPNWTLLSFELGGKTSDQLENRYYCLRDSYDDIFFKALEPLYKTPFKNSFRNYCLVTLKRSLEESEELAAFLEKLRS